MSATNNVTVHGSPHGTTYAFPLSRVNA